MLHLTRPILSLLSGVVLLLLGSGLLNTLLAIRGGMAGFDDRTMGLIMSGYFLGFFAGTFVTLPVVRRIGHIRTFSVAAAFAAVSVSLHPMFESAVVWGVLRFITGMSLVVLYTVIEGWLNSQTPAQQRGQVFVIYMIVNLAALAVAQQLLKLGDVGTFMLFSLSAMLVTLSLVPVAWTRRTPPSVPEVQRMKITTLWTTAPVAVAGALLSGLAMGAFWGMGAVFASRIGLDTSGVAAFVTAAIIGGALLQYPIGRYSDRVDRRRVLAMVTVVSSVVALLLYPAAMIHAWALFAVIAVYGGLAFTVYPLSIAHLIDHLDSENVLAGGSGLLLLHGIGAAVGPAFSGQLMEMLGPQALTTYFAVMQVSLAGFAVWQLNKTRKDIVTGDPAQFVAMVRTTPVALEMHPDDTEQQPTSTDGEAAADLSGSGQGGSGQSGSSQGATSQAEEIRLYQPGSQQAEPQPAGPQENGS